MPRLMSRRVDGVEESLRASWSPRRASSPRPRRIDAVGAAAREVHEPRESGVATHRS